MEGIASTFFNLFKRKGSKKSKPKSSSEVHNPVSNLTNTNDSSPQFITTVNHFHNEAEPTSSKEPALVKTSYGTEQSGTSQVSFAVEWVLAKAGTAGDLKERALVGGYDYDGTPLWVIRTRLDGELLPGKLNSGGFGAYIAWKTDEVMVGVFEVCCVPKHKVTWVEAKNGAVPTNAIEGGKTSDGEKLYIGRATYDRSLIPGKIQPSHECCYVTFAFKVHSFKNYDVLCTA